MATLWYPYPPPKRAPKVLKRPVYSIFNKVYFEKMVYYGGGYRPFLGPY